MSLTRHHLTTNESETLALGATLGRALLPGLVIYLNGELGAGKTTFARGVLRGLDFQGRVKSPSYTLVEVYTISRLYLYHFDFYRLNDPHGWIDAGLREYFTAESVCLVEWPQRAVGLPPADITVTLAIRAPDERAIEIVAHSALGQQCISQW